ncbi:NAD(P)H-hydrate dehydratase [Saccharophagus degradans]|uniref:Bifunctional NAD(P)H-hydrate repair enzyme n=1 Tax=Saccharophagus degradans TaxID=86304 RepID=A0AAW7X4H0_9GAMM|nr:NAD(P)H-hydrate dehydratase [Saccharophagus degradans]MDO6422538.1 NAD(P)H-hydrate dehydratase [Saccharophagus degradans]MDO6607019.1 NAD(P)H-hydrate dehydratase [Saccharophagus degradans]WGO99865.1 NAD(P)H-hydrate dehydratase [Saccharophagus degradans]
MTAPELPTSLYTCEQVKQLDALAIEQANITGIVLMKRAGRAAFELLLKQWPQVESVVVLCGAGNNGGDGYVIAALAAQKKLNVHAVAIADPAGLSGDALKAYNYAQQEGVTVIAGSELNAVQIDASTVIVDSLFGTGLSREIEGDYSRAIAWANNSAAPVLGVDLPSGLCGNTGKVWGDAIKCAATITFIGVKRGLLTGRGPAFTGDVYFDDLGVPASIYDAIKPEVTRTSRLALMPSLPEREADAHKGQFGYVLVVGGDVGMGGAAAMAGEAAARTGAGLTGIATQPIHVAPILARCPELMVIGVASGQAIEPVLAKPTVVVLGPGLGRDSWSEQMLQQATLTDLPLVMDADALNLLAEGRVVRKTQRDNWVLTPHPGEAARLLDCSVAEIQADRFAAARAIQTKYGGVVVLKGAGTIIASADQLVVANVGNPGMATGGMGDVLSGVIGALIAQGLTLFEAAQLGVCAHGDAADLAVQEAGVRGVMATDLIPFIRELLN